MLSFSASLRFTRRSCSCSKTRKALRASSRLCISAKTSAFKFSDCWLISWRFFSYCSFSRCSCCKLYSALARFLSTTSNSAAKAVICFSSSSACCSSLMFLTPSFSALCLLLIIRSSSTAFCPRIFSSAVSLSFISSISLAKLSFSLSASACSCAACASCTLKAASRWESSCSKSCFLSCSFWHKPVILSSFCTKLVRRHCLCSA